MPPEVAVLKFEGDFDGLRQPPELESLKEEGCTRLVLNMQGLSFISSAGLGYLIMCQKQLQEKGGDVVLSQPAKSVDQTIELLGLLHVFKVFPSDQDALEYFGGGSTARYVDVK